MNLYDSISKIVKDEARVFNNESTILEHSRGLMYHEQKSPDIVVYPINKYELTEIVSFAQKNKTPIVPYGIGSSLEGQIIPQKGGITLNFSKMNQIVNFSQEDFTVTVEPGVTREQLNIFLKQYGLFFPIDPGVNATIGGMTANNASGTNSIKYGVMKDQVLALEAILPDGRIIHTGTRAMKTASGYNLKDLFVGSEGTLAIFSEITLRLHGIPEQHYVARCSFDSIEIAGVAASELLSAGLSIGKLELVDALTIEAVNRYLHLNIPEKDSLFIECSGSKKEVEEQMKLIEEIVIENKGQSFQFEDDSLGKATLWRARHEAGMAIAAAYPGQQLMSTDVAVPLSRLTEAIKNARKMVEFSGLTASIFGHVGDGNFHVVIAFDKSNQQSLKKALKLNEMIVKHALDVGGTCTGEHGIGTGKIQYLQQEHGDGYEIMKEIKHLFDPNNIFNPDILFDN